MPRMFGLLVFALVALGGNSLAQAQTKPSVKTLGPDFPKTEIFIGNSFFYYNNSMHSHVLAMQRAADAANKQAYRATSVTISGSGIDWHDVESYFRPKAIGSYSFDENNNVVFNKLDKLFDVAIMMDCSQCPIHPTLKSVFTEFAKKSSEIVRAKGTTPVFFMSWAYADKPEMTAQLAEAYTIAGNANDALVIPAGLAFAKALNKQPEVTLYAADKRHPSLAGTYLAACVTFAALTGRSPVGNAHLAGLDGQTVAFLQNVAWDTVQEYYGK
ncbi:hypothetical protein CQ14_16310 [Bradyrhizobium lablabi]|uniref:SGNH/GDSL hydrolase family protein n=1 Tax=Bradyrhizobium lablabi TaxID=722472 RepID=A0A0R3MGG7_9BRAD|nr:hypothetical protein [Bradyrhizobium lablabi]KRR16435.1 hypothetical protein CQ14_16310 [Bradyrhizobium lablabi]